MLPPVSTAGLNWCNEMTRRAKFIQTFKPKRRNNKLIYKLFKPIRRLNKLIHRLNKVIYRLSKLFRRLDKFMQ